MKILLAGMPGSGKTTIATALAEKNNIYLIQAGVLIREQVEKGTDMGKLLEEDMKKGNMVKDELAAELVKEKVEGMNSGQSYIMDGYPRTAGQLDVYNPGFDIVFWLDVPEEVASNRLMSRGRVDDGIDIIKHRFEVYKENAKSLLPFFESTGKLVRINANRSVDEILKEVEDHLKIYDSQTKDN